MPPYGVLSTQGSIGAGAVMAAARPTEQSWRWIWSLAVRAPSLAWLRAPPRRPSAASCTPRCRRYSCLSGSTLDILLASGTCPLLSPRRTSAIRAVGFRRESELSGYCYGYPKGYSGRAKPLADRSELA
jgi:hypothetical protein